MTRYCLSHLDTGRNLEFETDGDLLLALRDVDFKDAPRYPAHTVRVGLSALQGQAGPFVEMDGWRLWRLGAVN